MRFSLSFYKLFVTLSIQLKVNTQGYPKVSFIPIAFIYCFFKGTVNITIFFLNYSHKVIKIYIFIYGLIRILNIQKKKNFKIDTFFEIFEKKFKLF